MKLIEVTYARHLKKIASHVGMLINDYMKDKGVLYFSEVPTLQSMLRKYAELLDPWARATAGRIGAELAIRERNGWNRHARLMGAEMRRELENAPTGAELQSFMRRQVELIKSLPIEAGERVADLVIEGLSSGVRANEIAKSIFESDEVTLSRAKLIARTEIATGSSNLTRVRAQSIGSEEYIWRTSRDSDVRLSHRKMEGRVCRWDSPPQVEPGKRYHAGCFPNCRCWPEPIIPGIKYELL